jgi:hypothetical protein
MSGCGEALWEAMGDSLTNSRSPCMLARGRGDALERSGEWFGRVSRVS